MAKLVYAKSNGKLVKKWRCTSGKRKGKLVTNPSMCFVPIDLKKRAQMKRTMHRKGPSANRKSQLTKKHNSVSRQVARLNQLLADHINTED